MKHLSFHIKKIVATFQFHFLLHYYDLFQVLCTFQTAVWLQAALYHTNHFGQSQRLSKAHPLFLGVYAAPEPPRMRWRLAVEKCCTRAMCPSAFPPGVILTFGRYLALAKSLVQEHHELIPCWLILGPIPQEPPGAAVGKGTEYFLTPWTSPVPSREDERGRRKRVWLQATVGLYPRSSPCCLDSMGVKLLRASVSSDIKWERLWL